MSIANPARLALHVLRAVLPHGTEVEETRVRYAGAPDQLDLDSAADVLERHPKPVACRARESNGILEVKLGTPTDLRDVPDNLIVEDLRERAARFNNDRVLVMGRAGHPLVTSLKDFVAFERDYQIEHNHFVRTDSPTVEQSTWDVIGVISYYPSSSHTHVKVSAD